MTPRNALLAALDGAVEPWVPAAREHRLMVLAAWWVACALLGVGVGAVAAGRIPWWFGVLLGPWLLLQAACAMRLDWRTRESEAASRSGGSDA